MNATKRVARYSCNSLALPLCGHAIRSRRTELLPALHAVQDRIGWISQPALNYISRRLAVPPAARVSPWYGYAPLDPAHLASMDAIVFVKDIPDGPVWWPTGA